MARPNHPELCGHGSGSAHPMWKGDDVSYGGAHQRVRRSRGKATEYECYHCPQLAKDWAYDHSDPDALTETDPISPDFGRTYSTDVDRYIPLCGRCHILFDHGESTHCYRGHERNEANTWVDKRTGKRYCRPCKAENQRRYIAKLREFAQ